MKSVNTTSSKIGEIHWLGALGLIAWGFMIVWGILPFLFIAASNLIMGTDIPITLWSLTKMALLLIVLRHVTRLFVYSLRQVAISLIQ